MPMFTATETGSARTLVSSSTPAFQPIGYRFGARLRTLRLQNNYTQAELAEYLGIDRSFISDVERGRKNISLPFLEVIAQGFKTSLSDLMKEL